MFQELLANDGVDARASSVGDPRVGLAAGEAVEAVLSSWDQVLCWREGVRGRAEFDDEVGGWCLGEGSKARAAVGGAASSREELGVGGARDVDEGGAGVDNTGGTSRESGGAVAEARNGDAPVCSSSTTGKLGEVGKSPRVLGAVGATKGQLAIGVISVAAGLWPEGDAENLGRDGTLRLEVVRESRDSGRARDGALGEVYWTKADDTINAAEARRRRGRADRLGCDRKTGVCDLVCILSAAKGA